MATRTTQAKTATMHNFIFICKKDDWTIFRLGRLIYNNLVRVSIRIYWPVAVAASHSLVSIFFGDSEPGEIDISRCYIIMIRQNSCSYILSNEYQILQPAAEFEYQLYTRWFPQISYLEI